MRKYLREDYNASDCTRIIKVIKDVRDDLSAMPDLLDWAERECEDIENGVLDNYGEQTLSRYTRAIYRNLYNLSKALSTCRGDILELNIDDM